MRGLVEIAQANFEQERTEFNHNLDVIFRAKAIKRRTSWYRASSAPLATYVHGIKAQDWDVLHDPRQADLAGRRFANAEPRVSLRTCEATPKPSRKAMAAGCEYPYRGKQQS